MNIFAPLTIAVQALRANTFRTLLTIVGIVIGIASVMVILSGGEAIKAYMKSEIDAFGSDYIQVEIKVPSTEQASTDNASGIALGISITTLTLDDVDDILELENIDQAYGALLGQDVVSFEERNNNATLYGVGSDYIAIDASEVAYGRFFTQEDDRSLAQVVVLGADLKDDLFGDREALGRFVKIGRQKYEVIGVLKQRGGSLFFNTDEFAFVPIQTLQKKNMGVDHIQMILATMVDAARDQVTKAQIEDILRDNHDIINPVRDDFAVTTQAEAQDILGTILNGVQLLLVAIAGISLVVGGVGIMNIMYVTVAERRYEIGLRKSVGATEKNILWQFLWEAIMVTGIGGIIGVVVGVLMTFGITSGAAVLGYTFVFTLPWWALVIAVGFSVAVGLTFGLYPAKQAAQLDPITALRKL